MKIDQLVYFIELVVFYDTSCDLPARQHHSDLSTRMNFSFLKSIILL